MLGILKTKKPYEQEAKRLYTQCLLTVRRPWFYTHCGLPDTMECRFDLITLHGFLLIERNLNAADCDAQALNQAFFDVLFADMDQTLREMGIGDMGLPKRMKKMMTGFNGRLHGYREALSLYELEGCAVALNAALARNVFAIDGVSEPVEMLSAYVLAQRAALQKCSFADTLALDPLFSEADHA